MGEGLSYCIAFSASGAVDVTKRYVRLAEYAAPRNRSFEIDLARILDIICTLRQDFLSEVEKQKVEKETRMEQDELSWFPISALLAKLSTLRLEDMK